MPEDRRSFLQRSWKVLAAVLGAEAVWTTWDFLRPSVSEGFGSKILVGAPGGFPEGEVRYFSNGRFYLVNLEGQFRALYQKCPHLGCRVPYCESSGRFECPCHGSVFNKKGEYLKGPSPRGMDEFAVVEGDEGLIVDTGSTIVGPSKSVRTLEEGDVGESCLKEGGGHGESPMQPGGGDEEEHHGGGETS